MEIVKHRDDLPRLLHNRGLCGHGVEVGVREGGYSDLLLNTTDLFRLWSVDPWEEQPEAEYTDISNVTQEEHNRRYVATCSRLAHHGARSVVLRMYSTDAARLLQGEPVVFVYIDANHTAEAVRADLAAWWRVLQFGGILAGHDYVPDGDYPAGRFGVQGAVDWWAAMVREEVHTTREEWPSWFMFKRGCALHGKDVL